MMLAHAARAGVRRHLTRASSTQLLSRPFAQVAEQIVDTSPPEKDLEIEKQKTVKARSLSLDPSSRFRVVDPAPSGFSHTVLKLLGYYGKQSRLIRGANTLYSRISLQVNQPELYANFALEQSFRTTHAMLVLYMWLSLCRVRSEGKDGGVMGQSLYDAFNHDLERRIIATGLKVLLSKWMKELEKNFYGAVAAYDKAMRPEADKDELARALWRYMMVSFYHNQETHEVVTVFMRLCTTHKETCPGEDSILTIGVALAGLITFLHASFDMKSFILGKFHYVIYFLVLAMQPRMLVTLDENLKPLPVPVRVGQAVDVVGQAGRPKSITGFQTHTTPVILATGDRAELATEKYIPLSTVLEGFVILKLNPDYQHDHLSS